MLSHQQCQQQLQALARFDETGTMPSRAQQRLLQTTITKDWQRAWHQLSKASLRAKCQAVAFTHTEQTIHWQPLCHKHSGAGLTFHYGCIDTALGPAWLASTEQGLHQLHFLSQGTASCEQTATLLEQLYQQWPEAKLSESPTKLAIYGDVFSTAQRNPVTLQPSGSAFELTVWQALLSVAAGHVASYGAIARMINQPNASRAVGSAIARNAIAGLIPCHRIVKAGGESGQYRWGATRKRWMLAREMAVR